MWGDWSNKISFFSSKHSLQALSQVAAEGAAFLIENFTEGWKPWSLSSQNLVDKQVPLALSLCLKLVW